MYELSSDTKVAMRAAAKAASTLRHAQVRPEHLFIGLFAVPYGTCKAAKAAGAGPYVQGQDPEYGFYRDADGDGIVCE